MKIESGLRFGRLVTTAIVGRANDGHKVWECACDCGAVVTRRSNSLSARKTPSCGCAASEIHSAHGMRSSREYSSWRSAKDRCTNDKCKDFPEYGGRGISMCAEWLDSFECFFSCMGVRPENTTLDRIDVNGNYEPGNCVWATHQQQIRNRRKSTYATWRGTKTHLSIVAAELGITFGAAFMRNKRGTL